jgi:hypothetical protein
VNDDDSGLRERGRERVVRSCVDQVDVDDVISDVLMCWRERDHLLQMEMKCETGIGLSHKPAFVSP